MIRLLSAWLGLILPALAFPPGISAADAIAGRWTPERAWVWYRSQPWLVGCNFLPSTAVNDVEMWQQDTFDPQTIDRELGWAQDLGFNTVRVFLNYVVWRDDAAGLKQRFTEVLKIADRHGISVMPILFDDCNFAGRVASVGKQPDPVPGVHNSQWVSSPPLAMVTDRSAWASLEQYVKDMVGTFGADRRVVVWDLYNEPGNGTGVGSQELTEAAFGWAREMEPSQPLTTGAWTDFQSPFNRRLLELSDVVSFHGYDPIPGLEGKLEICAAQGRPVLCTEWLVRRGGNTFERVLPLFRNRKIGCYNWGLVAGRTQTYFPWGSPQGAREPERWQHDILRADGTPFNTPEVRFIKVITGRMPGSALPPLLEGNGAGSQFKTAVAEAALDRRQVARGGTLQATYTFRSSGPSALDLTVFVHVVRPDGRHIGADFEPDLPTTSWPEDGFVREGPFPITLPADAAPGRCEVWVGMFSRQGGDRIELDNADRVRGQREYCIAEFEVLSEAPPAEDGPAVFNWLPVDEKRVIRAPLLTTAELPGLERLVLAVEPKVLNPVLEPGVSGHLTLTGIFADGSERVLPLSSAVITARTTKASGNVTVIAVEGDRVVAREGGLATVQAVVRLPGKRISATAEVVVRPFYREYHQTLVIKLFLGMEGEPVKRLASIPLFHKPHDVLCTFEEALEVIRKTDNLTRGIPKIIYLVGWQKGGHDHLYPAWSEVNPRLKRPQDATALESLRWLIREARKFNTTVSLHLNMVDAYEQSPLWNEYVAKDCLARDADGRLLSPGIQIEGEPMYNVVYPKEWEAGLAQRRIDGLIQMIPELRQGHTIHIDVFIAQREGGQPISPWHAKPENGGLTPGQYVETQRRIFHYWRDRGFDVTGEGIFWAHPVGEGFTGLQAMSWWYPGDTGYQMQIPECLMARGRTDRGGDGDFRFGSSMHGEEIWQQDRDQMPGFLGMFCRTTLPWYYLSRLERLRFENGALFYSDDVVARNEAGRRIIRRGNLVLREDDDLFVPALWNRREIIAYSRAGYASRTWRLPEDWCGVAGIDLRRVTMEGCVPRQKAVPVTGGSVALSMDAGEALSIVPAEATMPGDD